LASSPGLQQSFALTVKAESSKHAQALQHSWKSWVSTQRIPNRIGLQAYQASAVTIVLFFKPGKGLLPVAQCKINKGDPKRLYVALCSYRLQLPKYGLCIGWPAHRGIDLPHSRQRFRIAFCLPRGLPFSECRIVFPLLHVYFSQFAMRLDE